MTDIKVNLLVLGAGPGGYVCAIRAAKQGVDTLVVEEYKPGGTCLNIGCIPSKAMIHAADEFHRTCSLSTDNALGISTSKPAIDLARTLEWKNSIVKNLNNGVSSLLIRAGVKTLSGKARFLDGKTVEVINSEGTVKVHAQNIVIATGSEAIEIPSLPFGGNILSSTEALNLAEAPETLAVVGGGYIGLELGTAYAKLGSSVTVVESADRLLSHYDNEIAAPVAERLSRLNIKVELSAKAQSYSGSHLDIVMQNGSTQRVAAEKVLVTVGRKPRNDYGLEELCLTMKGEYLDIDMRCQTSMRGVYAIGDVTGEPMLAHKAMAQGEIVADVIAGGASVFDKACIPAVCFTDPEIVSVGLSPSEAKMQGLEISVGQFPLQANGRAMTLERMDGFIRVVARKQNGVVLGVQAVGSHVSELSAAFSLAIEMGARAEDIASTVHAHPTIGEAFNEASLSVFGHELHI